MEIGAAGQWMYKWKKKTEFVMKYKTEREKAQYVNH